MGIVNEFQLYRFSNFGKVEKKGVFFADFLYG